MTDRLREAAQRALNIAREGDRLSDMDEIVKVLESALAAPPVSYGDLLAASYDMPDPPDGPSDEEIRALVVDMLQEWWDRSDVSLTDLVVRWRSLFSVGATPEDTK